MTTTRAHSVMDRAFLTNHDEATQLVLVRHGQQSFPDDATATVDAWVDPPLSELGRRQVERLGEHLAREPVRAVYTSRLQRAADTGRAIARRHPIETTVIDDLGEIAIFSELPRGRRPVDELGEIVLAGARERFVRDRRWDVYPATEHSGDFRRRTVNAIEGVLTRHAGETVVVACHGGVINAYVAEMLGLREDMFYRPAHASVHRIAALGSQRVVQALNETYHLTQHEPSLLSH